VIAGGTTLSEERVSSEIAWKGNGQESHPFELIESEEEKKEAMMPEEVVEWIDCDKGAI
jgi:hypothetical protein